MNKEMKFYTRIALVVATFVAAMHAIWASAVALGIGQTYLDWIFPLHLLNNPYIVAPFNLLTALLLTVVAFVATYVSTLLFLWLWKAIKIK